MDNCFVIKDGVVITGALLDNSSFIYYIKICKNKYIFILINPTFINFDFNSRRFVIIIPLSKLNVKSVALLGQQKVNFFCAEGQQAQNIPYGTANSNNFNDSQIPSNGLKNCLTYLIDFKSLKVYNDINVETFYGNPFNAFNYKNDGITNNTGNANTGTSTINNHNNMNNTNQINQNNNFQNNNYPSNQNNNQSNQGNQFPYQNQQNQQNQSYNNYNNENQNPESNHRRIVSVFAHCKIGGVEAGNVFNKNPCGGSGKCVKCKSN